MKGSVVPTVLTLAILLALAGCRKPGGRAHERNWPVMGTVASLTVRGADTATAARLTTIAQETFDVFNVRFSLYIPDSELSRLNAAGTNGFAISAGMHEMLEICRRYHALTGGTFDPTVAPAVQHWGFSGGDKPAAVPEPDTLAALRSRIGFQHVQFDTDQARFAVPDMRLDVGGIAKGVAIDRAFERLAAAYDGPLLLNLGGEMRVQGRPEPARPWRIGVRNPFARDTIIGVLELPSGMATATSGNYERFVTLDGTRYSHIIDPRTAAPATGMAGVTVLCADSTVADALSTALFVLGLEAGGRLAARLDTVEALFVPDRQPLQIHATEGLLPYFTPEPEWREALQVIVE